MGVHKSFIESADLSTGQTFYVQATNTHEGITISFDGGTLDVQIRLESNDLDLIKEAIGKLQNQL